MDLVKVDFEAVDDKLPSLRNEENTVGLTRQDYIHAATSNNTRKAYQSDVRHFINWGGLLPASPESIVNYLHQYAAVLNPRTLHRRLTAIKQWHLTQSFDDLACWACASAMHKNHCETLKTTHTSAILKIHDDYL